MTRLQVRDILRRGMQLGVMMVILSCMPVVSVAQDRLLIVEWNVENLFDTQHDTLKNDYEFLPEGSYHWNKSRYWKKLNRVGQTIAACGESIHSMPHLVGLCEVENDTVLRDLTKRSLLRKARYEYVVTNSPDERGVDVALLYSPFAFQLLHHHAIRIEPLPDMRPTRDILYAVGRLISGDSLHVFVLHAPSRSGGERATRPYRMLVARQLVHSIDSIHSHSPMAHILVMGDFNDYSSSQSLRYLCGDNGMVDVSADASGSHGAKGTYRYQGEWGSLDHILLSASLANDADSCFIMDAPFLLDNDEKYGGMKPRRNYLGPRYLNGYADHLPLVLTLRTRHE